MDKSGAMHIYAHIHLLKVVYIKDEAPRKHRLAAFSSDSMFCLTYREGRAILFTVIIAHVMNSHLYSIKLHNCDTSILILECDRPDSGNHP